MALRLAYRAQLRYYCIELGPAGRLAHRSRAKRLPKHKKPSWSGAVVHVEPPYGILWPELKKGQIVAFLGAGASLSGRPKDAEWSEQESPFPPKGSELARLLAEESGFPSQNESDRRDLAKVASYYEARSDRALLRQRLRQVFSKSYESGVVHRFLAELDAPLLIVTTNYDNLIEQALERAGKTYHLVVHATDKKEYAASVLWWKPGADDPEVVAPAKLALSLTDTTILYKMHGGVNRLAEKWDNFVITEEDYMEFLARMTGQAAIPARFIWEFQKRRFLFLGYALGDWNLRVILHSLGSALPGLVRHSGAELPADFIIHSGQGGNRRSWSIQLQPSDLERWLWDRRRVEIFDMRIEEFVAKIQQQSKAHP